MRYSTKCPILFIFFNCLIIDNYSYGQTNLPETVHFYCKVDKAQFDTLKGFDFAWAIFKPINDTISDTDFDKRPAFIERLLTTQKVLYYTFELERSTEWGTSFANFYYNYKSDFPKTIKALTILKDTAMLNIMNSINKVYLTNYKQIRQKYKSGSWKYIENLFVSYEKAYLNRVEHTMKLLENFVRLHADEFIQFN